MNDAILSAIRSAGRDRGQRALANLDNDRFRWSVDLFITDLSNVAAYAGNSSAEIALLKEAHIDGFDAGVWGES